MKRTKYVIAACAVAVLAPLAAVHGLLRASLPRLDGELAGVGVVAPVTLDRDSLGIPTIEAANRVDLAFGTGFAHGQDRFFQMDLSRRLAAGELAELFGRVALEQDKKARLFRFRHVAREVLQRAPPEQRAILEAYARGVNAGLGSLRSRPWEYWLLKAVPVLWQPEDTILVSHAMWWDLQYGGFQREILRQQVNARLGGPECASGWKCAAQFVYPARTQWDAPNLPPRAPSDVLAQQSPPASAQASNTAGGAIPPPEVLDVRHVGRAPSTSPTAFAAPEGFTAIGSNNWAVAGRLTATGSALVANDMHLRARVPIVWYRARLRVAGTPGQPPIELNGVTLPGAPLLVAGSNGHIAWGFTNSYGTWIHAERAACTSVSDKEMLTASGPVPLQVQPEEIRVHGEASVRFGVKSGPAGVLFEADPPRQTCWFVSWLAQQPAATNMGLMGLERAGSVAEAIALAPQMGIPHQNFVVGDRDGHIAWTIFGRIPTDTGPNRASDVESWTSATSHPRLIDPEVGRIWTANARATDDPSQEITIGGADTPVGADYDLGARAGQIRDDLLALHDPATPADMLRIQLDDRAVFLTRWRTELIALLDADALNGHPRRARFKQLVVNWNSQASADSVGYRLVRAYHEKTEAAVWEMMLRALEITPGEATPIPAQFEQPLWRLVSEQPLHMLAAEYGSWREFLLAQVDGAIIDLERRCGDLARCTWGSRRPVSIRHPLSGALPFLARLLDMPTVELAGDHDMPRVQDGPDGASERFAVSPGHEEQGYLHIPGGQSGHPLSPYYRAGFLEWAEGKPLPFLPGPSQHQLTLRP